MAESIINPGPGFATFNLIEDTVFFNIDHNNQHPDIVNAQFDSRIPTEGHFLNLVSDNRKLFLSMPVSVYHFFIDFAARVSAQLKRDPELELVVNDAAIKLNAPGGHIYSGFLELLRSQGVKVTVVDFGQYDGIIFNKVYVQGTFFAEENNVRALAEIISPLIKDKDVVPFRKVFLSRRQLGNREHGQDKTWLTVPHDRRIDDHDKVESYFASLGFEIVTPEHFRSLAEQVNLFYETKTLVSTTSSGLVNAAFMQEGNTLVELQTPLVIYMPRQMIVNPGTPLSPELMSDNLATEHLHYFYNTLAFHKKHVYLALNNLTRSAELLEKTIESNPYLKEFIIGGIVPQVEAPAAPAVLPKRRSWLKR